MPVANATLNKPLDLSWLQLLCIQNKFFGFCFVKGRLLRSSLQTDSELLKVGSALPSWCPRHTTGPVKGGGKGGWEGGMEGRTVDDDEFGSEHIEFEMTINSQRVLEMQY